MRLLPKWGFSSGKDLDIEVFKVWLEFVKLFMNLMHCSHNWSKTSIKYWNSRYVFFYPSIPKSFWKDLFQNTPLSMEWLLWYAQWLNVSTFLLIMQEMILPPPTSVGNVRRGEKTAHLLYVVIFFPIKPNLRKYFNKK